MIYVLNSKGVPLMPTSRHGKVRHLLRDKKAIIVRYHPFTIQLTKEKSNEVQEVSLGVDTGYENIGLSVTTKDKVLFELKAILRTDIVNNISSKRQIRRTRRNRKTRYRKARFNNRKRIKGWLPPSVKTRLYCHFNLIAKLHKFLPIGKIVVEIAKFDIQNIKNPSIKGAEYQQGEQLDFWNVREYVLTRDDHKCRYCDGKSNDKFLNVHHIESRRTGSNAPSNLITLCETCHKKYHKGLISLDKVTKGNSYKSETFMGLVRNYLYKRLKETYNNVKYTYGYITKALRIENHLEKDHNIDARCILGNPLAKPNEIYLFKKVRCHNRQLHKCETLKGGKRKSNQTSYITHGFRLFDKVKINNKIGFVWGRRTSGSFLIKNINGYVISNGITYKKLTLIEKRNGWIFDVCQF